MVKMMLFRLFIVHHPLPRPLLLGAAFGGALRAAAQPALGAAGAGGAGAVERRRRSAASRRSGAVARIFLASWTVRWLPPFSETFLYIWFFRMFPVSVLWILMAMSIGKIMIKNFNHLIPGFINPQKLPENDGKTPEKAQYGLSKNLC